MTARFQPPSTLTVRRKSDNGVIVYEGLSDGEQMLMGRMALLFLLQQRDDSLLLLDEPETHFNDFWKREIVDIIDDNLKRTTVQVLVATHSSIALSDAFAAEIALLEKQNGGIQASAPTLPTFGEEPARSWFGCLERRKPSASGQRSGWISLFDRNGNQSSARNWKVSFSRSAQATTVLNSGLRLRKWGMLHRIDIPPEAAHLQWVVQLQERLMLGLCDAATASATVTVAWVQGLWNDAPGAWVKKFCGRKALSLMRELAGATAVQKAALLAGYLNDNQSGQAFKDGTGGFRFHGLGCCGGNAALAQTAKSLFSWFYEPHFDAGAGYSAPDVTLAKGHLDRPAFVEAFARHNNLGVCPYCDGTLAPKRAKVDHFYPKSEYPFLAVAPENLVPACTDCNSVQVKGARVPLAVGAPNEAAQWFHPYHRTADGQFRVEFLAPRANDQPRQLRLVGNDVTTQRRVDNLDQLLGVTVFWADRLKHRITTRINALRTKRRKKGSALTDSELREKCSHWADDAHDGKRHSEFAILDEALCRAAAAGDTQFLDELAMVNTEPL